MHLILFLSNVDLIVWIVDRWTNFFLYLGQSFLTLQQFLFLSVQILLNFFNFVKFIGYLLFHLINVRFQVSYFLYHIQNTSAVLFSVFSRALKLFNLISYSALAWAKVFCVLSVRLTAKEGPVGNWLDISNTFPVCSKTSVIFFSSLVN